MKKTILKLVNNYFFTKNFYILKHFKTEIKQVSYININLKFFLINYLLFINNILIVKINTKLF